jgi:hypothetical protein
MECPEAGAVDEHEWRPLAVSDEWLCQWCIDRFPDQGALFAHRATVHQSEYEAVSEEASALGSHALPNAVDAGASSSSEAATYHCDGCDRVFTRAAALGSHRRVHRDWSG